VLKDGLGVLGVVQSPPSYRCARALASKAAAPSWFYGNPVDLTVEDLQGVR
jgi:hypothetical protein